MNLPFKSLANWDSEDQVPHGENIVIRHSFMIAAPNIHHMWLLNGVFWNWRIHHFVFHFSIYSKIWKACSIWACVDYNYPIECDVLKPAAILVWTCGTCIHTHTYGHSWMPSKQSLYIKSLWKISEYIRISEKKILKLSFFLLRVAIGSE